MTDLFHITERSARTAAQEAGEYRMSTRGATLAGAVPVAAVREVVNVSREAAGRMVLPD